MDDKHVIDLEELKKIELGLLIDVANFCETNQINYFLACGTLIGAVRHKGFIPWDDDIDIIMPREDYENFINSYVSTNYKVLSIENSKDYSYPFAKVVDTRTTIVENDVRRIEGYGVFIDIFPMDGLPDNKLLRQIHKYLVLFWRLVSVNDIIKNPDNSRLTFRIINLLSKIIGWRKAVRIEDKLAKKYDLRQTDYASNLVCADDPNMELESSIFKEYIYMTFENMRFRVPKQYDLYLRHIYGNYMELPPVEKQVSNHCFYAYYNV